MRSEGRALRGDVPPRSGASSLDESAITGESVPVRKELSDHVAGGTMNVGSGFLVIGATATAQDPRAIASPAFTFRID